MHFKHQAHKRERERAVVLKFIDENKFMEKIIQIFVEYIFLQKEAVTLQ